MFKLESYITPIILNHVAKYVKNIRPQDSQVSLWGGEVAFQNLDLRLDVLEEELQLPFEFLSGHIHELTIHVPWTKITSEPINVTINTIEFVLKLKDSNSDNVQKKQEKKKKISKIEEPQQGYIPSLVSKIINNISINCHNIILKYVEDDIVVSMNVQLLSLSSANENWQNGFAEINATKVVLRKLIQVSDLTICLDKRNEMGQIEVCLEPILYKCSLEIRILRKYNVSTVNRSSTTIIHIYSKALDMNISSLQFPMAMRLMALVLALKSGDLKSSQESDIGNENLDDSEGSAASGQSYLSWAWNLLPNILSAEDMPEEVENDEGHFVDLGFYVKELNLILKTSEFMSESIVQNTRKIRYSPIVKITLKEIFGESLLSDMWFQSQAGIATIQVVPLGNYSNTENSFIHSDDLLSQAYLNESLFDDNTKTISKLYKKYITNLEQYMTNYNDSTLQGRGKAIAFDMVHIPESKNLQADCPDEAQNIPEKLLMRVMLSSTNLVSNSALFSVIDIINDLIATYNYPPYVKHIQESIPTKLPPPSIDEYDELIKSQISKREIKIILTNIYVELRPKCISNSQENSKNLSSRQKINLPWLSINFDKIIVKWETPINPNPVVFTTCQLPNRPKALLNECYESYLIEVKNINAFICDINGKERLLNLPYLVTTFATIIQPTLWTQQEDVKLKLNLRIDSFNMSFTRPQFIAFLNLQKSIMNYDYENLITLLTSSATRDLHEMTAARIEHTMSVVDLIAKKYKDIICGSISIKYAQSCIFTNRKGMEAVKCFIFRAPIDVPLSVDNSFCYLYIQLSDNINEYEFQPIVAAKISDFLIIFDPALIEFLNYEETFPPPIYSTQESSTSVDIISQSEKVKVEKTMVLPDRNRKIANPEETVHLSSEKEEKNTIVTREESRKEAEKYVNFNIPSFKDIIMYLEIEQTFVYIPIDTEFLTSISTMSSNLAHNKIDYLSIRLPYTKLKSALCDSFEELLRQKCPKVLNKNNLKDTFPWTCSLTNICIKTNINGVSSTILHPTKTNITAALDSNKVTGKDHPKIPVVNIHIDTSPIHLELSENQTIFIADKVNKLVDIFNLLSDMSKKSKVYYDESIRIVLNNEEDSTIKEFLAMKTEANSSLNVIKRPDEAEKLSNDTSTVTCWLQWTIEKLIVDLISNLKPPTKLMFEIEDFITSIDIQHEYFKLKNKVGNLAMHFFELSTANEWIINDCIRLSMQTETSKINDSFFDLTITQAETVNILTKLGGECKAQNLNKSLTEIVVNIQGVDLLMDLHTFSEFVPIFYAFHNEEKIDESSNCPVSVSDLPLVFLQWKGITIYLPIALKDVLIVKIGSINISPNVENPLNRTNIRPDVYNKAAQMRILHILGSKVEDRQYELLFGNISAATANWNELLSFLKKEGLETFKNTNSAEDWNNKQGNAPSLQLEEIFSNFLISITYAPCIVYENILISGEAIEFNCITDLVATLTIEQLEILVKINNSLNYIIREKCIGKNRKSSNTVIENNSSSCFSTGAQLSQKKRVLSKQLSKTTESTEKRKHTIPETKYNEFSVKSFRKESEKGINKSSTSDYAYETFIYPDSGIEVTTTGDGYPIYDNIQTESAKERKIPSELSFVAGVFHFKFIFDQTNNKKQIIEDNISEEYTIPHIPICAFTINQPSMLISQKIFENFVQFSLFSITISFNEMKNSLNDKNKYEEYIELFLETQAGPITLSRISPPLLWIKKGKSEFSDLQIDFCLMKPIIVNISYKILEKFFKVLIVLEKIFNQSYNNEIPLRKSILRGKTIQRIRKMLYDAGTIKISMEKFTINVEKDIILMSLSIVNFDAKINIFERPEKLIVESSCGAITIGLKDKVILHPVNFTSNLKMTQEIWHKDPIAIGSVKINVIHIDIGPTNITDLFKIKNCLDDVFEKYNNDRILLSTSELQKSNPDSIDKTKLKLASAQKIFKDKLPKEEFYQDDLRAGAFQFIVVDSDCDLPLAYQIQIILKNNGIICWRYPQPRRIIRLQTYPIPMDTNKPLQIQCRMEYYSHAHENFLHFCDFFISETGKNLVNIQNRKITSNIWRVVILQSFIFVDGQCFECACSSDEDEELKSIKIEDIFKPSKHENDFRLNPKALVACMRVDTIFSPVIVPKIEAVINLSLIQVNLHNEDIQKNVQVSYPLHKYSLPDYFFERHTFATILLSNINFHGAMLTKNEYLTDINLTINCKILDYSYLSMLCFLEDTKITIQADLSDSVIVNTTVDVIKINVGPTTLQTIMVSYDHWEKSLNQLEEKYAVFTRYIICNKTNINIMFGQADTREKLKLKPQEVYFYHFLNDYHDQKLIFGLFIQEKVFFRSDPICVDEEGIQYVRIAEHVLIVEIKKLSTTQIIVYVTGQISILSMTSEKLKIQLYNLNKIEPIPESDSLLEYKTPAFFCMKFIKGTELYMRLKLESSESSGWSGKIPIHDTKKLPWLVKVPKASQDSYISFWVRIIAEEIGEIVTSTFTPKRILVIIWPMFTLRSMLPLPVKVKESITNLSFYLPGKGEQIDLSLPGNNETEHIMTFMEDFVSSYGEDKNNVTLSFKTIDWNKFFWFDEKLWTIENSLNKLTKLTNLNWPNAKEEENQIKRFTNEKNNLTPIYRCYPSQDFSCSLLLDISVWALFINSIGETIQLRNYPLTDDALEIKSNYISTIFMAREGFVICIKIDSEWAVSKPIYLFKSKSSNDSSNLNQYYIEESGSIVITIQYRSFIWKLILNSSIENGYRLFTLLPIHVISNFSKYNLEIFGFCISEKNHVKRSTLHNIPRDHYKTLHKRKSKQKKGLSLESFYDLSTGPKHRFSTQILFYVCLKTKEHNEISIPIKFNAPLNRKCISLLLENTTASFAVSVVEHKKQYFLNIYDDICPAVSIFNYTELSFFIAQAESFEDQKETKVVSECDSNFSKWYQILKSKSHLLYTPPEMYRTFPDIESHVAKLALAIRNGEIDNLDNNNELLWSKPIRTDVNTEKYFNVPLHGDVSVVICDKHKSVRMYIFYATRATVFCVKDLRSRLNSTNDSNALLFDLEQTQDNEDNLKITQPNSSKSCKLKITEDVTNEKFEKCNHGTEKNNANSMNINLFIKEITISIFVDLKEKKCLKTEVLSVYVDDFVLQFNDKPRKLDLIISNLQMDNQLFSTGNYDFPVILCSEELYKRIPTMPTIYNLQNEIENSYKLKPLLHISVKLYDEEYSIESIRFKFNPIRVYIEDMYLNDLLEYLIECNSENFVHLIKKKKKSTDLKTGEIILPKEVVNQFIYLSEPLRLRSIRIDSMRVLISVHTCVRLYIALDHSPLEFSSYEKKNIITLPMKLGHALGMHYLSGALFGAGWVVGSLEILGSPSGLARSVSIGLRDFVSMPVQGLLRGPWGFVLGITQGSASLLKNITAGTVNSVTKLAASVARNIDRLTLDEEHFQRTEAIRRSRPQGFTEGLSQGLTGFGISLLGAVGGIARHTLEARSPVQVVTGVGKGIVGAFAKPISGAAELVALTGQGMLHTVGFNAMPTQRFPTFTRNTAIHLSDCKIAKLLPDTLTSEQILFFHEATVLSGHKLKRAIIFITKSILAVLDVEKNELVEILPLEKIEASFDDNDRTLIDLHLYVNFDDDREDQHFTNQRIMNYLQSNAIRSSMQLKPFGEDVGDFVRKEKLNWSFYINEQLGQHLLNYLKIITKNFKDIKYEKVKL